MHNRHLERKLHPFDGKALQVLNPDEFTDVPAQHTRFRNGTLIVTLMLIQIVVLGLYTLKIIY